MKNKKRTKILIFITLIFTIIISTILVNAKQMKEKYNVMQNTKECLSLKNQENMSLSITGSYTDNNENIVDLESNLDLNLSSKFFEGEVTLTGSEINKNWEGSFDLSQLNSDENTSNNKGKGKNKSLVNSNLVSARNVFSDLKKINNDINKEDSTILSFVKTNENIFSFEKLESGMYEVKVEINENKIDEFIESFSNDKKELYSDKKDYYVESLMLNSNDLDESKIPELTSDMKLNYIKATYTVDNNNKINNCTLDIEGEGNDVQGINHVRRVTLNIDVLN
jgi:hypothetical protein